MKQNKKISITFCGLGYVGGIHYQAFKNATDSQESIYEIKGYDKYKDFDMLLDCKTLTKSDVFIISLPTDINSDKSLKLECFDELANELNNVLEDGNLIIMQSTSYVGFTEDFIKKLNKRVMYGFVPERNNFTYKNNSSIHKKDEYINFISEIKIISGSDIFATELIKSIYSKVFKNYVVANSIKEAELTKLYENSQRNLLISFANEIKKYAEENGIDFDNIVDLTRTKKEYFDIKAGLVGGHCIPIDVYYLLKNINSNLIKESIKINDTMVDYHKNRILSEIKKSDKQNILFLGVTFKANSDDLRNSKYLELANELKNYYNVEIYDPYNTTYNDFTEYPNKETRNNYFIILGANHDRFEMLDESEIGYKI